MITPSDNKCTACGVEGLTFAADVTRYYQIKSVVPFEISTHCTTYLTDGDHTLRVFCPSCGEAYTAPDGAEDKVEVDI